MGNARVVSLLPPFSVHIACYPRRANAFKSRSESEKVPHTRLRREAARKAMSAGLAATRQRSAFSHGSSVVSHIRHVVCRVGRRRSELLNVGVPVLCSGDAIRACVSKHARQLGRLAQRVESSMRTLSQSRRPAISHAKVGRSVNVVHLSGSVALPEVLRREERRRVADERLADAIEAVCACVPRVSFAQQALSTSGYSHLYEFMPSHGGPGRVASK